MFSSIGRSRFLTLAALVFLLMLVGLLTMKGGMLALALALAVYLAATLLQRPPKLLLSAERSVSADSLLQNTPVEVTVKVQNEGPDLDEILIEDILPQAMTLADGKTRL